MLPSPIRKDIKKSAVGKSADFIFNLRWVGRNDDWVISSFKFNLITQ